MPEYYIKRSLECGEERWEPLPGWCKYLIDCGHFLGDFAGPFCARAGISLPTGCFAASFIAFGICAKRGSREPISNRRSDNWSVLDAMVSGQAVYLHKANRRLRGVLEKEEGQNGIEYWVRYSAHARPGKSGDRRLLINDRNVCQIEPAKNKAWETSLPYEQKGRKKAKNLDFLTRVLGDNVEKYCRNSLVECLIVGTTKYTREECSSQLIGCKDGENIIPGALGDVVRPGTDLEDSTPISTLVESSSSSQLWMEFDGLEDTVVLFHGSNAFLKHRHRFRNHTWVAIFDRSENRYEDAITEYNREQIKAEKVELSLPVSLQKPPDSFEISVFAEGK